MMRRYLRGAAPKLLVVFLCVAGVCALTAAALLAVLQQRDESAGPPYTACAVVDGVLDESTGTVLYNTPHATAPGEPLRYVAPRRRSSRKQALGFNPSRDVQTLGTFSCGSPLEEPTGLHKGKTPVDIDDTIRLTTATMPPFPMACYEGKIDIVCQQLHQQGVWEGDVSRALQYAKDYLPAHQRPFPATVVVDVGANVGFFGLLAAAQGHHVYMFEPGDVNRALIRSSMCMNPAVGNNVMLFPYGGGEHQQCRMYSDVGNVGDGHTTCDPTFVLPDRYAERSAIQLAPLEEVLGTDLQVFLLKIDVEGYELDVMRTAKHLLKGNIAFITTEVSLPMMGKAKLHAYFQLLWDSGFVTYKTFFKQQRIATRQDIEEHLSELREHNIFGIHTSWSLARQAINAAAQARRAQDASYDVVADR